MYPDIISVAGMAITSAVVIVLSKVSLRWSRFRAWSWKYGITCGSAAMSPAVTPEMVSVGSQWWPLPNCTGNVQMFFWSRRKSLGNDFHVTSRAAGDLLSSAGGREDCWLSGSPPPVVCAKANVGAKERPMQKTMVSRDCLVVRLIAFLDAVLWSRVCHRAHQITACA